MTITDHPIPAPTRRNDRDARLARNWWAIALRGLFGAAFGFFALLAPGPTLLSLALAFAVYLVVDGIAAIVAARHEERWGWLLVEGLLSVALGVAAFLFPTSAVLAFVLVTAAWAVLSGAAMLAAAFQLRADHGRWWMTLGGAASVVFGIMLALAPAIGAVVLTWWLGAYALVFGALMLGLGLHLRGKRPA